MKQKIILKIMIGKNFVFYERLDEILIVKKKKEEKTRKKKNEFNGICSNCNRSFKTEKIFNEHTLKQICFTPLTTTYCKLCNIKLSTRSEYELHLVKLEHIQKLQSNFNKFLF